MANIRLLNEVGLIFKGIPGIHGQHQHLSKI